MNKIQVQSNYCYKVSLVKTSSGKVVFSYLTVYRCWR